MKETADSTQGTQGTQRPNSSDLLRVLCFLCVGLAVAELQ
jgi:hypothetical protein